MMITVGVDLSTTKIGVCVLKWEKGKKHLLFLKEYELPKYSYDFEKVLKTHKTLKELSKDVGEFLIQENINLLALELANFSNPLLTQRFSRVGAIVETLLIEKINIIKVFNSNEWRQYFAMRFKLDKDWIHFEREKWKTLSKEKAGEFNKTNLYHNLLIDNDNLSDAFWISYFAPHCLNTIDRAEQVQKQNKLLELSKIYTKKIKGLNRTKKELMSLVNSQINLKEIEKINRNIAKYETKLKELKNGN